ncbi:transposase, partial [Cuniculiplasma sp. SKW4]
FHISYRSSAIFLRNHGEYMEVIGIREILSFQTLSRRAGSFYLHSVNREITFLYAMELIVAIDSFMIHTCKYSTAARRRVWGNYADPESGWSKTSKSKSYGRKCHVAMDIDSLIVQDWVVTKGNIHDSKVSHYLIDAARNFSHILADSAYDTSGICDYIFENTNERRGIRPERLHSESQDRDRSQ